MFLTLKTINFQKPFKNKHALLLNPIKYLLDLTTYMVAVGFLLNSWLYCSTFLVCLHNKTKIGSVQ